MTIAMAFDDAKANQRRQEGGGGAGVVLSTPFLGARDKPDLPHANLNQHLPGRHTEIHFHLNDQFQVVVDGRGKLGRHNLSAYGVHFSRAYTPYGPLVADTGTGLTFFVMRAHGDPGAQLFPEKKDMLKRVPNRRPWQITRAANFPEFKSNVAADTLLQPISGIKDENGLAAYTLRMKPNARAYAPDPSHGDGQYLVVVKGSLLHNEKEHKAFALVFVEPKEGPFQIYAGSQGLEAIVLNFPQKTQRALDTKAPATAAGDKKWRCALCAFAYDEVQGMPEEGIAAGTRWEDVPDTWTCPDCSASKSDFEMVQV